MTPTVMRIHIFAFGLLIASAPLAWAQTPTPTPADDRPNFSGAWSLDREISNDPSHATFDAPADPGRRSAGRQSGGFAGRGGRGGFGSLGGYGDGQSSRTNPAPGTPEERTRLREFTDLVKRSSGSLVIAHADPSLAITDPQGRTQVFQTNGAKDTHTLATTTVISTTHWDGSRLVTEYDMGTLGKLVSGYVLLAGTKQLVVRMRLEMPEQQRTALPELKLVYNLTGPAKPTAAP